MQIGASDGNHFSTSKFVAPEWPTLVSSDGSMFEIVFEKEVVLVFFRKTIKEKEKKTHILDRHPAEFKAEMWHILRCI